MKRHLPKRLTNFNVLDLSLDLIKFNINGDHLSNSNTFFISTVRAYHSDVNRCTPESISR